MWEQDEPTGQDKFMEAWKGLKRITYRRDISPMFMPRSFKDDEGHDVYMDEYFVLERLIFSSFTSNK